MRLIEAATSSGAIPTAKGRERDSASVGPTDLYE